MSPGNKFMLGFAATALFIGYRSCSSQREEKATTSTQAEPSSDPNPFVHNDHPQSFGRNVNVSDLKSYEQKRDFWLDQARDDSVQAGRAGSDIMVQHWLNYAAKDMRRADEAQKDVDAVYAIINAK
jgi:hypothetical protein